MGTVRIQHINDGWTAILSGGEVQQLVKQEGERIASAACAASGIPDGFQFFGARLDYGRGRAGGFVDAVGIEARAEEARSKVLEGVVCQ